MGSKPFSLSAVDWKSIGKGLLINLAGALLTYIPLFAGYTYVVWDYDITPFMVVVFAVLTNIIRKYLADTRPA